MIPVSFLSEMDSYVTSGDDLIRRASRRSRVVDVWYSQVHLAFELDGAIHEWSLAKQFIRQAGCLIAHGKTRHTLIPQGSILNRGLYGESNGHSRYVCQEHGEEVVAGWVESEPKTKRPCVSN